MNSEQTATTEARTLFALSGSAHHKVADIPLGHLMLSESHSPDGPDLALRVEAGDNAAPAPGHGILRLRTLTNWNGMGAVVHVVDDTESGVDLGEPTFVLDANPIARALANRVYDASPGMLALCNGTLIVMAAYGPYVTHRAWWDVKSGKRVNGDGRILLAAWRIGLRNIDGTFIPQLRYPEDFKRE